MSKFYRLASILVILCLFLAACRPAQVATPTPVPPTAAPATATPVPPPPPTATPAEEPLYLAIIWHQHQPLYYKDPATGIYAKPWVRVHAAKDYLDMATMLEKYPQVHVTFNLTPSLIKQLDDFAAGAKDMYQVMTEKSANQLTDDDKRYILRYFFDTNPKIIARFPRYKELADKRGGGSDEQIAAALQSYTEADFRDLQVLFNLAWTDPDWLAQAPLKALVDKARNFSEDDKKIVLGEHLRIIKEVIPEHAKLQKAGQIEVTMTPYPHPILPLIYNTDLAKIAMPDAKLPSPRFSHPEDAIAEVKLGVKFYQDHFGIAPKGMWPAEGAVAQEIVKMVSDAGIQWMASDEEVEAKSLGLDGFTRDSKDVVQQADKMYQPYNVRYQDNPPVAVFFRDHLISDKVGFTYSGQSGQSAADDFMARLLSIKARLKAENAQGPHVVTVILDGENAWEYYDNDGKDFLNALYKALSESKDIQTVFPSEYLAKHPATGKIDQLWAGSWINHNFDTWIGEDEENRAWDYLRRARDELDKYVYGQKTASPEAIAKAFDAIYAAEGSDWFWWYGDDQNSGNDADFDAQFRQYLAQMYTALGEPVPDWVYVPIIPRLAPAPAQGIAGTFTPSVDGSLSPGEWDKAGLYPGKAGDVVSALYYGFDAKNIYLLLQSSKPWKDVAPDAFVGVYLASPKAKDFNVFSRYGQQTKTSLGFGASHEVAVQFKDGVPSVTVNLAKGENVWEKTDAQAQAAAADRVLEIGIPWAALGELDTGDAVSLLAVVAKDGAEIAQAPASGAAKVVVPELGTVQVLLTVKDPKGDDHGPGSYTYPTDAVFKPAVFDLDEFTVGDDGKNLVFRFKMYGPIENVWGSPNGLSVCAYDVYIDVDHKKGSGATLLLPGRNARVADEDAWDFAIWAEGWTPGVYKPGPDGNPVKVDATLKTSVDPVARLATLRVPKDIFGNADPKTFSYLALVLGQDGVSGVNRIRVVNPTAAQWSFGGGPADTNHTRIIDLAWPADAKPTQEEMLSKYTPSQEAEPPATSYATLPMLTIK